MIPIPREKTQKERTGEIRGQDEEGETGENISTPFREKEYLSLFL